jgi:hypothetical protein
VTRSNQQWHVTIAPYGTHLRRWDSESAGAAAKRVARAIPRRKDWQTLRLKPERELEFVLADGTTLERGVSECTFELEGRRATSPVVLGETEDEALLGAVTLETLGLMLNPLNRTLQPMRLVLARAKR